MRGYPGYGSWESSSCDFPIRSHIDWEAALLSLCRFLAYHPEVSAAELVGRTARCWLFSSATGASAWGVLWSLDAVLTTAYLVSLVVCFMLSNQLRNKWE